MTDSVDRTRRELLAAAGVTGAAAVAGCGTLDDLLGGDPTVDGGELVDVVSEDDLGVGETVPVGIERSFAATHRDRAESLLSSVPVPLDETDVPNGAVREGIAHRYEEARKALDTVRVDEPVAETVDEFARVRGLARTVAVSWAAVGGNVAAADVREEMTAIRADLDAFQDRFRYVGTDPVDAVVTFGVLEGWHEDAIDALYTPDGATGALWLGEFAGTVERARTHSRNLRYLFDRHRETLPEERSFRERFVDATDRLTETVEHREGNLPANVLDQPRTAIGADAAESPAGTALAELADGIRSRNFGSYKGLDQIATPVLEAHRMLTEIGAVERLDLRIGADEYATPTDIEDVRQLRTTAIEAIRAADGGPRRHLTRQVLNSAAGWIEYTDEKLREEGETDDDGVSLDSLRYDLARYVRAREMSKVVADTSETVAAELQSA
ncbi:hypothetical protein BV210_09640 [Halorientalis sp. IM1011]|uniref:hypothetical protein n=1 Tax=Halorientalis sp. IM1011 TaxID=1932360 RepID=UPI00097CD669|nr:hypothetical protein [Halorientalis sp. IM1011]AQL42961.1 hypothetical protein BV210_09640 [Halorientalis sp. IM1011]